MHNSGALSSRSERTAPLTLHLLHFISYTLSLTLHLLRFISYTSSINQKNPYSQRSAATTISLPLYASVPGKRRNDLTPAEPPLYLNAFHTVSLTAFFAAFSASSLAFLTRCVCSNATPLTQISVNPAGQSFLYAPYPSLATYASLALHMTS